MSHLDIYIYVNININIRTSSKCFLQNADDHRGFINLGGHLHNAQPNFPLD